MRRTIAVSAAALAIALPLFGAIGSPASAAGCVDTTAAYTTDPASGSGQFNASIGCDGVWVRYSFNYAIKVKGQYLDGTWQNSSLTAKWVYPWLDQSQVVGNTVDGRRLRGHRVDGAAADYVVYKH